MADFDNHIIKLRLENTTHRNPTDSERVWMKSTLKSFTKNHLKVSLLNSNILDESTHIRLENPLLYQEMTLRNFYFSTDRHLITEGKKDGVAYTLQISQTSPPQN